MPDDIDRVLTFVFGTEHEYYRAGRVVWGLPILFQILPVIDEMAADLAADRIESPAASSTERARQWLARSIVSIDKQPYAGVYEPGSDDPDKLNVLKDRMDHLSTLPARLFNDLTQAYLDVNKEYATLLDPPNVKN